MNTYRAILHARPGQVGALRARLATLPGVEVHAATAEGRLIVSIEAEDDATTTATFETLGALPGVLSASLIYHQTESDPDKELSYETDAA